ncbi:TIM barrel protein [Duganella radicis]|uniref:TIM barrel protein n=1 Tax=Duganella radicis TaxID=551988 RepID=A0A6L6PB99_9BURK|nr:TIM barrel protein [Duganella radicis]
MGVQLWSVKDELRRDFDGVLIKLAQMGFQGVEFAGQFGPYRQNPVALRALLDRSGLACAGAHVDIRQLAPQHFEATTAFYRTLGCNNLVISADRRGTTPELVTELGRELTTLSATLATQGMRIGYHNHAQEMAGTMGSTPWDLIAQNTPAEVILQQDVGWTVFAGKNPVTYVQRYPGRSVSMHLKAKLPVGAAGKPLIGQDGTDWKGLVSAAHQVGGTQWLIVEQEEYPDGMGQLDAVRTSLTGLRSAVTNLNRR